MSGRLGVVKGKYSVGYRIDFLCDKWLCCKRSLVYQGICPLALGTVAIVIDVVRVFNGALARMEMRRDFYYSGGNN